MAVYTLPLFAVKRGEVPRIVGHPVAAVGGEQLLPAVAITQLTFGDPPQRITPWGTEIRALPVSWRFGAA